MLLLKTCTPWLLLAVLGQLVSLSSGHRGRSIIIQDDEETREGKFSPDNSMQCEWHAEDSGPSVELQVKCENPEASVKGGITKLSCIYRGDPNGCKKYESNSKLFWEQVGRSIKKTKGRLCNNDHRPVRAAMCSKDAHFSLELDSIALSAKSLNGDTVINSTDIGATTCKTRKDCRKPAKEYCSKPWIDMCSFFFLLKQLMGN